MLPVMCAKLPTSTQAGFLSTAQHTMHYTPPLSSESQARPQMDLHCSRGEQAQSLCIYHSAGARLNPQAILKQLLTYILAATLDT